LDHRERKLHHRLRGTHHTRGKPARRNAPAHVVERSKEPRKDEKEKEEDNGDLTTYARCGEGLYTTTAGQRVDHEEGRFRLVDFRRDKLRETFFFDELSTRRFSRADLNRDRLS